MIHNTWATSWEQTMRIAISDEATLLAGHNDLAAGGITNLAFDAGRVTAMATARYGNEEAHTVITVPVVTREQAATLHSAATKCDHARQLRSGHLPDCLTNPAHTGNMPLAPTADEVDFVCTCGTTPCRHAAALAHAVTDRLTTHPAELAVLRDLLPRHNAKNPAPRTTDTSVITTSRTTPSGNVHVTAHHAWSWYRERAEPPYTPDHSPKFSDDFALQAPTWPTPPHPAPREDELHALLSDAAAQARCHLLSGTPLESAWDDDAIRLASTIPKVNIPVVAERLGIDVADLRERIASRQPPGRASRLDEA